MPFSTNAAVSMEFLQFQICSKEVANYLHWGYNEAIDKDKL